MSAEERRIRLAARRLGSRLGRRPEAAVILGSGLGGVDLGRETVRIPYADIPGFPRCGVPGHPGRVTLVGNAAILRGRAHVYEGLPIEDVVRPVRVLSALGARVLVVTNAAGAIRRSLRPGDLMRITDHLNLMGVSPLRGDPLDGSGPRFLDMTRAYDADLARRAQGAARRQRLRLKRGVYAAVPGPSYETPAEVRMLGRLGADAVGMSTVPEVLAAVQAGMRVLGLSCITNAAAGLSRGPVSHDEVLRTGTRTEKRLGRLLREILAGVQGSAVPNRP